MPAAALSEITSSGFSDSLLCVGCVSVCGLHISGFNMAVPRKFGSAKQVRMAYARNVAYAKLK